MDVSGKPRVAYKLILDEVTDKDGNGAVDLDDHSDGL